jgi:hypothetical protein
MCDGQGKLPNKSKIDSEEADTKECPKCKGRKIDEENIPTYSDEIQTVSREYPAGNRAIRVTWESVSDFNARLSNNLRWNLDHTLDAAKEVVQEFIEEETKKRVKKEHRTKIVLDVVPVQT